MPYIITVNRPGVLPEQDPYAVTTIEEARDAAAQEVERSSAAQEEGSASDERLWHARDSEALRIPEAGGTVGPLPDGYVIDVRRVTYPELAALAGVPFQTAPHPGPRYEGIAQDHARIIDAYNGQ